MVKIGLLSDTHSHLDDKMLAFLDPVDEIWHAGDIGNYEVFEKLEKTKSLRAVYGNIDNQEIRMAAPKDLLFSVDNISVFITHIGGYPGRYAPGIKKVLRDEHVKLFVSGHSHILKVMFDKSLDCLHINPGAAGISGFHQVRTMVRFAIDGANIKDLEVWEMPRR
jgi:putative phosphoesterase